MPNPAIPFSSIGTFSIVAKSFTITKEMGIVAFVLEYVAGAVTLLGNLNIEGLTNTPQALGSSGFAITGQNAIDNFVIDATAGSCIFYVVK